MQETHSRKILVTGGTGFTGSHLTQRLISRGHQVTVLDNQKGRFHDHLARQGARIVIGSVTDKQLIDDLVAGQEVVQHVAAAFRRVDLPKSVYWDVNVNGTRNLLEAAARHGVRKFVYTSTCGVHGNVENPPAPETAPIQPADYYQYTKYEGEKVAHEFMRQGLDVTILRPAAIYGPGDPERWLMLFKRVASGRFFMLGDGKVTYHPLYIANLVDAYELAMEQEAASGQTYLIADERYYTINELVQEIAAILGVKVTVIRLPFWPVWAAAAATEAVSGVLRVSPPLFRRRVDWFRQSRAFDIGKAKREMGYQPRVDLRTGLIQTAQWYKEQRYLPNFAPQAI
jgi:nucleoside-diphosphate-sugar epimerase